MLIGSGLHFACVRQLKGEELYWEMPKAYKLRVLYLRAKGFLTLL